MSLWIRLAASPGDDRVAGMNRWRRNGYFHPQRGVTRRQPSRHLRGSGRSRIAVSPGAFGFARRLVAGAALLTGVLAIVGTPRRRKDEPRSAVDEVIGAHTESVLLTRTAPPGPRWIEVSQWDDLVKASRFMGRPILRLEDGTRSPDQPLFYVPDGPQSYVYDFQEKGVNASKSGGYVLPTAPEEPVTVESLTPLSPEPPETIEPPPAGERLLREPARRAEATTVPVPDEMPIPNDDVVEQYLGPNVREPEGAAESFDATKVEGEIREIDLPRRRRPSEPAHFERPDWTRDPSRTARRRTATAGSVRLRADRGESGREASGRGPPDLAGPGRLAGPLRLQFSADHWRRGHGPWRGLSLPQRANRWGPPRRNGPPTPPERSLRVDRTKFLRLFSPDVSDGGSLSKSISPRPSPAPPWPTSM